MQISKLAVAIVAAASVAVGAAAGFLATRDAGPVPPGDGVVSAAADGEQVPGVEHSDEVIADAPGESVEAEDVSAPDAPRPGPATPPSPAPAASPKPAASPAPKPNRRAATPAPPPAEVTTTTVTPIVPAVIEPPRPLDIEPPPAAPPAPELVELELPGESVIGLQLESSVSSETARVEDEVVARVTRDVKVGDHVAIPAGSTAHGEVMLVERGGKMRERARLGVRFTSIALADGTRIPISTEPVFREGDAPGRESATKIGGGAIGGAIIGGILGGAKGAAIGGSIGAGAGSAAVLAGGRNPATLSSGSPVTVRLEHPATVVVTK